MGRVELDSPEPEVPLFKLITGLGRCSHCTSGRIPGRSIGRVAVTTEMVPVLVPDSHLLAPNTFAGTGEKVLAFSTF